MHELFAQVLSRRDLSRAGDLFSLPDAAIVDDLSEALDCIADITSSPDYVKNDNDQAVVEICITRITTAIRDTSSLILHVKALVNLWETCLHFNLKPGQSGEDPPHAKIASDIMSCLFMQSCGGGFVLQQILDVAVCFLHQGNREITRNVTSYLALAAIQNIQLMSLHTSSLISSVLKGNFTLCCVLPQIYPESPEMIHCNLSQLLGVLPDCDEAEKGYLLQLVALIAKDNPQVLSSHVGSLIMELNNSSSSAELILAALVDIASSDPSPLDASLPALENAISRQPSLLSTAVKIFGAVGRLNEESARDCLSFLVHHLSVVDQTSLPAVLIEIKSIADQYQGLLTNYLHLIGMQSQSKSTATRMIVQQLLRDNTYSTSSMVSSIGSKQQSSSSISETENSSRVSESDNHPRQYKKRQSGRPQSEVPPQGPPMLSRPHSEVPLGGPLSTRPLSEIRSVAHNSRERSMLSPKSQRSIHSVDRQSLFKHELPPYHEVPHSSQLVAYSAAQRDHRPSRHDLSVKADISRNGSNGKLSRRSLLSVQSQYMKENSPPRYNPPPIRPGMERYRVKDSQSSLSDRYEPAVVLRNRANPPRISTTEGRRMPPTGEQNRNSSIHQYLFRRQREMCNYVDSIKTRIPIPQDCTVSGGAGGRPVGRVDFFCCQKSMYCLYDKKPFIMDTKHLQQWIHLMFLHLQATSSSPVSLGDKAVQSLKKIWEEHKSAEGNMTFLKLITQNFPSPKVQQSLVQQLCNASYYDLFMYDSELGAWSCFVCSNPSKLDALSADRPLIEGQLKEKKVRWKLFKRWRTQYFTLAGERLFPRGSDKSNSIPIEISKVRSVKTVGRRRDRTIPKAFEIFTDDHKTYMFKAKDGSNAEQWVQCLTLAMHKGKHTEDVTK
ncbi:putative ventricular zone-expressed PH domain-containing protein 1 [Apostichopus japonicus]|uniref:Putative ventricular zone-expressed PH domain-containing protein 1 n=1 Tax=Stichopus japonicus TaxID=307972 RepID=A0A2G8LF28_STIJA|nr:putative ventricular zone-expressed PH domain-containing protein 1 [Apostichopus japonicus]